MNSDGETQLPQIGARRIEVVSATVPGMATSLRRLRLERGWTHDEAADKMGISRGQFIKLERGERGLTARTIDLAAKAFSVPRSEILTEGQVVAPLTQSQLVLNRDLPVYAAAEGGPGEMVVSTDPLEHVPRPWYMQNIRDGYAVLIVGDSMSPVFEPGDIAVVNPRLPPMRGKDHIFISGEKAGEFTATIKRLIKWTDKDWYVCQFNPQKGQRSEYKLSRAQWPKALRIVGKQYGG